MISLTRTSFYKLIILLLRNLLIDFLKLEIKENERFKKNLIILFNANSLNLNSLRFSDNNN